MNLRDKAEQMRAYLDEISEESDLESLAPTPSGFESVGGEEDADVEVAQRGISKIARQEDITPVEMNALEAIVLPRKRPVVFIQNDSFGNIPDPWTHFSSDSVIRQRITAAIPAVGRVELPDSPNIPYGGTSFVVGPNLLMTNRHVAQLFATGLGLQGVSFRPGQSSVVDFKREHDSDAKLPVTVKDIVMIHPFWDMAILRVDGLPAGLNPLTLSVNAPADLTGREVVVIGYPARDPRNDAALQDRIFKRTYYVKRLHPGKVRKRQRINSFGNSVNALTHDSSTLGGNSGSAVVDVSTGQIIALHFAGIYLKSNYAVPSYELARDRRVVDAGLNFAGQVAPTDDWLAAWRIADPGESPVADSGPAPADSPAPAAPPPAQAPAVSGASVRVEGGTATWTIPLSVSVSLGQPAAGGDGAGAAATVAAAGGVEAFPTQVPVIYEDLESREGYDPDFLDLGAGAEVPLPKLTQAGRKAVAKLDDGSAELRYHKFSLVMHKQRRMALFTAANVDFRPGNRKVDGKRPTRRQLSQIPKNVGEQWVTDPRIPDGHQLPDVFFTEDRRAFDKGHLVRRDAVCWGSSFEDIQKGNGDTYHTTNCSPQVADFNRPTPELDNWGNFEKLVQQQTNNDKAIVFSGPVLAADDPEFVGKDKRGRTVVQIPKRYWKIVVVKGEAGPEAYGFVFEQDLSDVAMEFAVPEDWKKRMRKISGIERMLNGLVKLKWLKEFDQYDNVQ